MNSEQKRVGLGTILTAAKNPLGWPWDTPGSEVHIMPILSGGMSDVHLGAGRTRPTVVGANRAEMWRGNLWEVVWELGATSNK